MIIVLELGKLFQNLKGISGTTVLGSGEVALILDVGMLFQRASFLQKEDILSTQYFQDATGRTIKIISALSLNVWNTLEVSDLSAGVYTIHPFNSTSKGNSIRFVKL